MTEQDKLSHLRGEIDNIDVKLQEILNKRVSIAQEIANLKREYGDDEDFYRPEREAQVLRKIMSRNPGPLSSHAVATIFREIMSAALAAEAPISIGYLGPEGTYTQAAAVKHFGKSAQFAGMVTIDDVFQSVEKEENNYGVVPVENSIEGVVTHTLDKFMDSPLKICGEVHLRIRHQLLGKPGSVEKIELVYAHSQSFAQCRGWLSSNLSRARLETVSSNAEAARLASQTQHAAAIAGISAAKLYGLDVLASDIEDNANNTTRFLVIGRRSPAASGDDKTSLIVASKNKPGALYRLLAPFAKHDISMTRIESRPSRRGLWEYVFFIDIEGHKDDASIATALAQLEEEAAFVKILGAYPRSVL